MKIKYLLNVIAGMLAMSVLTSCESKKNNDEPLQPKPDTESVTIVYAVNNSSLASDFVDDSQEMLLGMEKVDGDRNKLLVFHTVSSQENGLFEAVKKDGKWEWQQVKQYERVTTATDPEVFHKALTDACNMYPDIPRTLIMWGHGTSWTPYFTDHTPRRGVQKGDGLECYGYGGENGDGGTKWMDIDDLAKAIPHGEFQTIWFDCCYMSSAEVAYQLRNKAQTLVAYPTEVWDKGLNYDDVLPFIMSKTPSLEKAASVFYEYYSSNHDPVTVAIWDLTKIDLLADCIADILKAYPDILTYADVAEGNISNYRRGNGAGYYDLRQLMNLRCDGNAELLESLDKALEQTIKMHLCSNTDFNGRPWPDVELSGVSMHNFRDNGTEEDEFYKTLDWYKNVY